MSKVIGVITNDADNVFQREVISGIRNYAGKQGYSIAVDSIAPPGMPPQPISLDFSDLAGVLVVSNVLNDDTLREIYTMGKPLSLVSHQVVDTPIPAVIPDNVSGITQLVNYLVDEHGSKRIAFINGDMSQNDGIERSTAFRQAMIRHNILIDEALMLRGDFIPETAVESTRALLDRGLVFDALAAADYLMAIAAMQTLLDADIKIPEEVCVVGFGDAPEAADAGLTTVGVDIEKLGICAARQLIGQIQDLHIRGVTLLNTSIVPRKTC